MDGVSCNSSESLPHASRLYTRYPIVARALGLAAAREQRNLAYKRHEYSGIARVSSSTAVYEVRLTTA